MLDCVAHKLDCQTRCAFIPSAVRVHPDGALLVAASERGLVQCFDVALGPIRIAFSHDEQQIGSNVLDTGQYFLPQMSLADVRFSARCSDPHQNLMANSYFTLRYHVRTTIHHLFHKLKPKRCSNRNRAGRLSWRGSAAGCSTRGRWGPRS